MFCVRLHSDAGVLWRETTNIFQHMPHLWKGYQRTQWEAGYLILLMSSVSIIYVQPNIYTEGVVNRMSTGSWDTEIQVNKRKHSAPPLLIPVIFHFAFPQFDGSPGSQWVVSRSGFLSLISFVILQGGIGYIFRISRSEREGGGYLSSHFSHTFIWLFVVLYEPNSWKFSMDDTRRCKRDKLAMPA